MSTTTSGGVPASTSAPSTWLSAELPWYSTRMRYFRSNGSITASRNLRSSSRVQLASRVTLGSRPRARTPTTTAAASTARQVATSVTMRTRRREGPGRRPGAAGAGPLCRALTGA
ncbi:hypothetical protein [Streptomyces dangxiongensis]|uniref:hypothetical protein n=1 Tax=Streptomyces dangxiongensis TaxID=1442032 RepID=UPI001F0909EE|nr:hypothetical protein [Streptomyces dangxiongensis]